MLVYTHYFGWLVIVFEWFYLLFRRREHLSSFTKNCLAVFLMFLPWMLAVVNMALKNETTGDLTWQTRPGFAELIYFYGMLSGEINLPHATLIGLLIFFAPIALYSWQIYRTKKADENWRLLLYFFCLPVLLVFSLSYLLPQSIWEGRYLIIAALPFIILAVKSAFEITSSFWRLLSINLILTWSAFAGIYQFTLPPKKNQLERGCRTCQP